MNYDVFISYNVDDCEEIAAIQKELDRRGITYHMSHHHEESKLRDIDFIYRLRQRDYDSCIYCCDVLLAVVTNRVRKRRQMPYEVETARNAIPVCAMVIGKMSPVDDILSYFHDDEIVHSKRFTEDCVVKTVDLVERRIDEYRSLYEKRLKNSEMYCTAVSLGEKAMMMRDEEFILKSTEIWDKEIHQRHYTKYGFMDDKGSVLIPFIYDYAEDFVDGLALVKLKNRKFLIDKLGKKHRIYKEGFVKTKKNGKWGYADKDGNVVIKCVYDWVNPFKNGLAVVRKGCENFIIDKEGNELTTCGYEKIGAFENGMAPVKRNGCLGYIDVNGKEVVECLYYKLPMFRDGRAVVERLWQYVIDENGNDVINASEKIIRTVAGCFIVRRNSLDGIMDADGKVLVPLEYKYDTRGKNLNSIVYGSIVMKKNGVKFVFSPDGKLLGEEK